MVDKIHHWSSKAEIPKRQLLEWVSLSSSKFYDWCQRYGKVNEHNGLIPRDHWLEPWEKEAIMDYHEQYPLEGYRRLTYMMMDADVVAVSPSSVRIRTVISWVSAAPTPGMDHPPFPPTAVESRASAPIWRAHGSTSDW